MKKHIIYLETSGNQAYIFSTNKLREVVGASEIISRVGKAIVKSVSDGMEGVEIIISTSGKALLLADNEETARRFINEWSRRVLMEAPGVDAMAVFSAPVDMTRNGAFVEGMADVHHRFESARVKRTAPQSRFPRLPVVADCRTSGLPAAVFGREGSDWIPLSQVSKSKWDAYVSMELRHRLQELSDETGTVLFDNLEKLEKAFERSESDLDWLAVVHADGNGLGEVFIDFERHVRNIMRSPPAWLEESLSRESPDPGERSNEAYKIVYRRFSEELDDAARIAFRKALQGLQEIRLEKKRGGRKFLPIVPLVVGGDDLTVLVDGTQAISFTKKYAETFSSETSSGKYPAIAAVCRSAGASLGAPQLGMSAGISITKPHFPFHASYSLAEELLRSAKQVKNRANKASSAIDFHILYDSTAGALSGIRRKLDPSKGMRLTAKPYIVSLAATPAEADKRNWCHNHNWSRFFAAVSAINEPSAQDSGHSDLPSSQAHMLRTALFRDDQTVLEKEFDLLQARYRKFGNEWGKWSLAGSPVRKGGLFVQEQEGTEAVHTTVFLDALEARMFLKSL